MYHLQEVRKGDWMQSYTGKELYPIDMRLPEVDIIDIAGSLSKMCRYNGHCLKFYSVAEHCVLAAKTAPDELKLTMLLHDASEAYLTDVPRPLKPYLPGYYEIENQVMEVVAKRFGIQWPLPAEVKRIDNAMLADERDQIMAPPPRDWCLTEPPLGVKIQCWQPDQAFAMFMQSFYAYGGKR